VLGRVCLPVLAVIFLLLVVQINGRISAGHSGDFRHFYFAARALGAHEDLYRSGTGGYLYPPLIAFLYAPIARLTFESAQRAILIFDALLAYGGIVLTAREFVRRFELPGGWSLIAASALLGAMLNLDKIHAELQMFQTNSLMFFMFALTLVLLDRRPLAAGIPLGVIFNIKYLSLGMLPWLIIRRRWGTAGSYVVSAIAFALLPAVVSGWHVNLANLGVAYGGLLHMLGFSNGQVEQANVEDIRDLLSCSITSAMARTTHRGQSLLLPMLGVVCIVLGVVSVLIWRYRRNGIPLFVWPAAAKQTRQPWLTMIGLEFVTIVALTLCFSPQTNTRHLMLALLVTIPLSALLLGLRDRKVRGWMLTAALVLAIGFIFPPGGQAKDSIRLVHLWSGIGGQCWCLLFATMVLCGKGLPGGRLKKFDPVRPCLNVRHDWQGNLDG
jgi:hypothetical protein